MAVVVASVRMVVILASPFLLLSLFFLLGLTVAGQETVVLHNLHEQPSIAVTVGEEELPVVSFSVILAERWLKNHVLSHYPSTNISTIVVGKDVNCNSEHQWTLVLPSVKNLHYSLARWGLVRDIKVSVAFSHDCLEEQNPDLAETRLKPLLQFLPSSNSIYSINPHLTHSALKTSRLISAHHSALEKIGFSNLKITFLEDLKLPTKSRKLISSSFTSSPYMEKHKPSNHQPRSPLPQPPSTNSPFAFVPSSSPSDMQGNSPDSFPLPPSSSSIFPPSPTGIPKSPSAPLPYPPSSSHCPSLPAANPSPSTSFGQKEGVWCVAKPAVPADILQKGIDFACGEGGADCDKIEPDGSCYFPDNLVAHAAYAYNSYWQKTKNSGGSCGFDGTAILIDSDPSFQQCRFGLS